MIGPGGILNLINDNIEVVDGKIDDVEQIAYETEKHFHNYEKWFGAAAVPVGETHVADEMDGVILPFQLTSGNSAYNPVWTQILGSEDLPVLADNVRADAHRALITTTNSTEPFVIQIVTGEAAGIAELISAKLYSVFPFISATNNGDSGITEIKTPRIITPGVKAWARCACVGQNAKVINFYLGVHEYLK